MPVCHAEQGEPPVDESTARVSPIRVLIIDRHQLFARSLAVVLDSDPEIVVVGTLSEPESFLTQARWIWPNVVLVSYAILEASGAQPIAALLAAMLGLKLIVLTACSDDETLSTCLKAGAVGYVRREGSPDEVLRAIKQAPPRPLPSVTFRSSTGSLAPRELEVLRALAAGMTTDEAARQMGISVHTVRTYVKNLMRKLEARTALQAVIVALKAGWIELPE